MTVREFLNSGIDISWNDKIVLYIEKFPPESIFVENPQYLWGFPDDCRVRCEEKFKQYLDNTLETITSDGTAENSCLVLSLF